MAEKLEVFVLEPCEVDWFAFSLWLEGCSEEAANEKRLERELETIRDFADYDALLRSETRNHYRMFRALEPHLHNPPSLFAQVGRGCKQSLLLLGVGVVHAVVCWGLYTTGVLARS